MEIWAKNVKAVLLYMRGVPNKELELLLEFIYTGLCQVEATDLKPLLRTVRELGYEGILLTIGNRELYVI